MATLAWYSQGYLAGTAIATSLVQSWLVVLYNYIYKPGTVIATCLVQPYTIVYSTAIATNLVQPLPIDWNSQQLPTLYIPSYKINCHASKKGFQGWCSELARDKKMPSA